MSAVKVKKVLKPRGCAALNKYYLRCHRITGSRPKAFQFFFVGSSVSDGFSVPRFDEFHVPFKPRRANYEHNLRNCKQRIVRMCLVVEHEDATIEALLKKCRKMGGPPKLWFPFGFPLALKPSNKGSPSLLFGETHLIRNNPHVYQLRRSGEHQKQLPEVHQTQLAPSLARLDLQTQMPSGHGVPVRFGGRHCSDKLRGT